MAKSDKSDRESKSQKSKKFNVVTNENCSESQNIGFSKQLFSGRLQNRTDVKSETSMAESDNRTNPVFKRDKMCHPTLKITQSDRDRRTMLRAVGSQCGETVRGRLTSQHKTGSRFWCDVGPSSATLAQHHPIMGSSSRLCQASAERLKAMVLSHGKTALPITGSECLHVNQRPYEQLDIKPPIATTMSLSRGQTTLTKAGEDSLHLNQRAHDQRDTEPPMFKEDIASGHHDKRPLMGRRSRSVETYQRSRGQSLVAKVRPQMVSCESRPKCRMGKYETTTILVDPHVEYYGHAGMTKINGKSTTTGKSRIGKYEEATGLVDTHVDRDIRLAPRRVKVTPRSLTTRIDVTEADYDGVMWTREGVDVVGDSAGQDDQRHHTQVRGLHGNRLYSDV